MYYGQTRPMAVYERQIRYLDFCENGQRSKGAGFLKVERQDNLCSISLQVSGLYRRDRLVRPLFLLADSKEQELCKIELADGGIKLYLDRLDCASLDGQGMAYEDWTGIRIPISENKEICCKWGMEKAADIIRPQEASFIEEAPIEEAVAEKICVENAATKEVDEFIPLQEIVPTVTIESLPEEKEVGASEVMKDTKWEQLWAIYPHKTPFSDEREYLSMGPGDFVILGERHFKLANNSFLLHGYYNYQHLILTRIREKGQSRYYIGVPGLFMEREKKTAVMFGFQSFESAIEPAEEGDFGYYMIPVEL